MFVDATIPQISWEFIFADTDIGRKRKWNKNFLFKKICWNDFEGNLLVLENNITSIIIRIY